MSAVPAHFMPAPDRNHPAEGAADEPRRDPDVDSFTQKFGAWFAIGVLIFCWIAEATLCAERGF